MRRAVLTAALALCLVPVASAAQGRPGIRAQVFSMQSSGTLSGRAFLLFSSRDVRLTRAEAGYCTTSRHLVATARLPTGPLRAMTLDVLAPGPGEVPIGTTGCTRAAVTTELEDGSRLDGGDGTVRIDELRPAAPGAPGVVRGSLSQTVRRDGVPTTVRATFVVPLRG